MIAAVQRIVNRFKDEARSHLALNVFSQHATLPKSLEGSLQVTDISLGLKNPAGKRAIFGWMMFDWAAQPFFTVVITFVFGPYFAARMAADPNAGQLAWSNVGTISSIVIA